MKNPLPILTLFLLTNLALAQNGTVSGTVKDNNQTLQKTGIVYHLRRVKVSHPRRTKVSIVGRMNVSH